ncbi:MAG: L-threonylcarbamoyladenylate synthase [Chthoniobacterales bacterium]
MLNEKWWGAARALETRVVGAGGDGVREAAGVLRDGGCVGVPTETVYGLAADALSAHACSGIFEAKGRPLSDPLIVHVPEVGWLDRLTEVDELGQRLAEAFWPGPLTLVLPRRGEVPDIVTAGQVTVAVRMSAHPVMAAVLAEFGGPVAAPSANRFGRISPTTAAHVAAELGGRIPLIVDGGACEHGIESTIVAVADGAITVLRAGPVTAERLREFAPIRGAGTGDVPVVPGAMKSHYAPATRLELVESAAEMGDPDTAVLLFRPRELTGYGAVEVLAPTGDLREAAANLYGAMRRLDESGAKRMVAEIVPGDGIAAAIRERMGKAAA